MLWILRKYSFYLRGNNWGLKFLVSLPLGEQLWADRDGWCHLVRETERHREHSRSGIQFRVSFTWQWQLESHGWMRWPREEFTVRRLLVTTRFKRFSMITPQSNSNLFYVDLTQYITWNTLPYFSENEVGYWQILKYFFHKVTPLLISIK